MSDPKTTTDQSGGQSSDQPSIDERAVNEDIGYEEKDIRFGLVIGSIVGLVALTVIAMLVSFWFLDSLETQRVEVGATPLPLLDLRPTPPAPRLQPNPIDNLTAEEELAQWLEHEAEILSSYGWVNEDAGVARIPITRAMELLVEQAGSE